MLGDVSNRAAEEMAKPDVEDYFTRLIQRVAPKSRAQALAEVTVTRRFLANFSADQVWGSDPDTQGPAGVKSCKTERRAGSCLIHIGASMFALHT